MIQWYQVGHRTEGDQVQVLSKIWLLPACIEPTVFSEFRTDRTEQIKHHTDTGQRFAWKCITGDIGIYDGVGIRQLFAGEVVISDDNLATKAPGQGNTRDAGYP